MQHFLGLAGIYEIISYFLENNLLNYCIFLDYLIFQDPKILLSVSKDLGLDFEQVSLEVSNKQHSLEEKITEVPDTSENNIFNYSSKALFWLFSLFSIFSYIFAFIRQYIKSSKDKKENKCSCNHFSLIGLLFNLFVLSSIFSLFYLLVFPINNTPLDVSSTTDVKVELADSKIEDRKSLLQEYLRIKNSIRYIVAHDDTNIVDYLRNNRINPSTGEDENS